MKTIVLKEYGLKKTPGRERVIKALRSSSLPLTAEDIFNKNRGGGENISTVYRALVSFEKVGIVKREINENGENSFILTENGHSHVIVCVKCHKTTYLKECPYEKANRQIAEETGYDVFDHNVQLFGLCPQCQKKEKKKARLKQ